MFIFLVNGYDLCFQSAMPHGDGRINAARINNCCNSRLDSK